MVYFHSNLKNFVPQVLLDKLNNPFDWVPLAVFEPSEDEEDEFEDYVVQDIDGILYYCAPVEYDFTDNLDRAAFKFDETFQHYISIYCPVDTGRLLGNCFGFCDPTTLDITCWANTPYAEYVEFGTSRMLGQHYMQRTIEEAIRQAVSELAETMFDTMNNTIEEVVWEAGGMWSTGLFGEGLLGFFTALIEFLVLFVFISPIIMILVTLADICNIGKKAVNLEMVATGLYGIDSNLTPADDKIARDFFYYVTTKGLF